MKSVICSSSAVAWPTVRRLRRDATRGLRERLARDPWDSAASSLARSIPNSLTYVRLP